MASDREYPGDKDPSVSADRQDNPTETVDAVEEALAPRTEDVPTKVGEDVADNPDDDEMHDLPGPSGPSEPPG